MWFPGEVVAWVLGAWTMVEVAVLVVLLSWGLVMTPGNVHNPLLTSHPAHIYK